METSVLSTLSIEDRMEVKIKKNALQWINTHHLELSLKMKHVKSVSNKCFDCMLKLDNSLIPPNVLVPLSEGTM